MLDAIALAYRSGDPYLFFAKQAGHVPTDGTRETHGPQRDLFKQCILGVQYAMGEVSLAQRIGQPVAVARNLLRLHHETYGRFWAWSDAAVNHALLHGSLHTVFGWRTHVEKEANTRSLRNFLMQSNGAEMLRLACCLATEQGIQVCAPVHDALLVEGPADDIAATVKATQDAMREASGLVLGGFELGTDTKIITAPNRYSDKRGKQMWEEVIRLLPP